MWRLILVFAFIPAASSANVMTFDGMVWAPTVPVLIEDGITATGSLGTSGRSSSGNVHVARAGEPVGAWIDFTMDSLFSAESVMIRPGGSGYCATGDCTISADPIDYIWFSGFLDGSLVSTLGVYRAASAEFELFDLGFLGTIDRLRIEARTYIDLGLSGKCSDGVGCGHFDVDNVRLNPTSVPEPATLSLLLAGLVPLLRRRRAAR